MHPSAPEVHGCFPALGKTKVWEVPTVGWKAMAGHRFKLDLTLPFFHNLTGKVTRLTDQSHRPTGAKLLRNALHSVEGRDSVLSKEPKTRSLQVTDHAKQEPQCAAEHVLPGQLKRSTSILASLKVSGKSPLNGLPPRDILELCV